MFARPDVPGPEGGSGYTSDFPPFDLVLGTDTGVGKTLVVSGLAHEGHRSGHRVAVLKPVQTGALADDPEGDLTRYRILSRTPGLPVGFAYAFSEPLDPMTAASRAGVPIEAERILALVRDWGQKYDRLIVEGTGGVLSPFFPDGAPIHSIFPENARQKARVILVSHPHLGSLSQVLSAVRILEGWGLPPSLLYLVRRPGIDPYPLATGSNPETLKRLLPTLPIRVLDSPRLP